jgi:hypothetical protein
MNRAAREGNSTTIAPLVAEVRRVGAASTDAMRQYLEQDLGD